MGTESGDPKVNIDSRKTPLNEQSPQNNSDGNVDTTMGGIAGKDPIEDGHHNRSDTTCFIKDGAELMAY